MRFWPKRTPNYELRVLMVCTGNICRSPTAHAVLRHKLALLHLERRIGVESAGTFPHQGSAPDPRAIAAAKKRGYEMSDLRARGIEPTDFERHDLVLAMDEGHVSALEQRCPPALRDRIGLLLQACPRADGVREVPDPYYGPPDGFDVVLDLIETACDQLARDLAGRLAP